jgi:hypothetical protein
MVPLVKQAWREQGDRDKPLGEFLAAYEALSVRARAEQDRIGQRRPELRNVAASKDWKESAVKAEIDTLVADLADRMEGSVWTFTKTDPLPSLYDESIVLSRAYAKRWRHLPNAMLVEIGFTVPWQGFSLTGRIDDLTLFEHPTLGPFYGITDAKTHREDPFAPKLIDAGVMYRVAMRECIALARPGFERLDPEMPMLYGVDAMRLHAEEHAYRWFEIDEAQERRLLRVLEQYQRGVRNAVFTPAANRCDFMGCGYREICEHYYGAVERNEMNLWFNTGEVSSAA